jgi:hypothetical protein
VADRYFIFFGYRGLHAVYMPVAYLSSWSWTDNGGEKYVVESYEEELAIQAVWVHQVSMIRLDSRPIKNLYRRLRVNLLNCIFFEIVRATRFRLNWRSYDLFQRCILDLGFWWTNLRVSGFGRLRDQICIHDTLTGPTPNRVNSGDPEDCIIINLSRNGRVEWLFMQQFVGRYLWSPWRWRV